MAYLMNKKDKIASLFQSCHYKTVIESLAMINKCNTSATYNEFKWAKDEYTGMSDHASLSTNHAFHGRLDGDNHVIVSVEIPIESL